MFKSEHQERDECVTRKNTSGLLAPDTAFYKSADLPGIPCSNLPRVTLEQQQTNKTKKRRRSRRRTHNLWELKKKKKENEKLVLL